MHSVHLVGMRHADHFSLRTCGLVIGAFGLITIVSYFNELAKAGLLTRQPRYLTPSHRLTTRSTTEYDGGGDKVILQSDGQLHHLDLNILPLQKLVRGEGTSAHANDSQLNTGAAEEDQEIKIALHLGKNSSYELAQNDSKVKVYQYQNVMSNFFFVLNSSIFIDSNTATGSKSNNGALPQGGILSVIAKTKAEYQNRTKVLVYQHDPGGYAVRDCFIHRSAQQHLVAGSVPLNAVYRKDWEQMSHERKSKFDVLYGGLSFGVCEGMDSPCTYAIMLSHPVDLLMHAYAICKTNDSKSLCRFHKPQNMSGVVEFIRRHGNSLFQKMLYYSRHCRLVGRDEVCVHSAKTFFLLSPKEKQLFLQDILDHLESWFAVVGLVDHFAESLWLFEVVLGLKLRTCAADKAMRRARSYMRHMEMNSTRSLLIDDLPYEKMREQLLQNAQVMHWLEPDMAIYNRSVEIYHQQVSVYKHIQGPLLRNNHARHASQSSSSSSPSIPTTALSSISSQDKQPKASQIVVQHTVGQHKLHSAEHYPAHARAQVEVGVHQTRTLGNSPSPQTVTTPSQARHQKIHLKHTKNHRKQKSRVREST